MIGGKYTLRGGRRDGRLGAWHTLSDQDGLVHGGLSLDPSALDEAAARRLSDAIRANNLLPGILSLIDQAAEQNVLWLISATPASPTVKQALETGNPIPGAVSLQIAVDCGQTLTRLHEANLAHGDLNGDTVVLGATGAVTLVECGYAHALVGTTPGPGHDVNGWVALLRSLAQPRPDDTVKQLLLSAAMTAEASGGSAGLAAGLVILTDAAPSVPGFADRGSLALVSATVSSAVTVAAAAATRAATANAGPGSAGPGAGSVGPGAGAGFHSPGAGAAGAGAMGGFAADGSEATAILHTVPDDHAVTLPPQELATRLGNLAREGADRSVPRPDADGIVRFGRGVAAPSAPPPPGQAMGQYPGQPAGPHPASAPGWNTGTRQMPAGRGRKLGLIAGAITFLLTMALVAVIGYVLYDRSRTPLAIAEVAAAPAKPVRPACDFDVSIVGKVTTNGERGTIQYVWQQIDQSKNETTKVLTQDVDKGTTSVDLYLTWQFRGKGTVNATAVLKILAPQVFEAQTKFVYSCK